MTEIEQPPQNGIDMPTSEDDNTKARPADIEQVFHVKAKSSYNNKNAYNMNFFVRICGKWNDASELKP